MPKTTERSADVVIQPPRFGIAKFRIRGIAPYVQNKFSAKARAAMRAAMEAGSTAKKGKKKEPKDFKRAWQESLHVTSEGWHGIPATSLRNAMISACRMAGFKMTHAKLSVFVEADGFDVDDGTPLIRITKGKPEYVEHAVRLPSGTTDLCPRPMWREGWEADVRVRYDADQFTLEDVANLLLRAGMQVGIGCGRPDSKQSAGMGWGLFTIVENGKAR